MRRALRVGGLALFTALVTAAGAPDAARGQAADPEHLLRTAFDRSFDYPGVRRVEIRVHRRGRVISRRGFDYAHRRDADGIAQSLLRFTAPEYLRGNALLIVESSEGTSDTWLYQPEERRPRRVGTQQQADSFYGTDLSFEDLEHRRWERFALEFLPDAGESGRVCRVVEAVPQGASQYGRLHVFVDAEREIVLRIDFFRGSEAEPTKRLRVRRGDVEVRADRAVVRGMRIEQIGRDAFSDVAFTRITFDAGIAVRAFSAMRLEREHDDLFDWVGASPESEHAPAYDRRGEGEPGTGDEP